MMLKNILYGLIICFIAQGPVLAMRQRVPRKQTAPWAFSDSQGVDSLSEEGLARIEDAENGLADFEAAFNFLLEQLGDAKKGTYAFGKRLWERPLTECLKFYARIYQAISLIISLSGFVAGFAVIFYLGPALAYKFISLTWQFAEVIRWLAGSGSNAGEQCFARLADGKYLFMACDQLRNMGINAASVASLSSESMQQVFNEAVVRQAGNLRGSRLF